MSSIVKIPLNLYNKFFLSEKQTNEFDLDWSLNPVDTYNKLVKHKLTKFEICHYTFLSLVNAFVFVILPINFLFKFLIFAAYLTLSIIPLTSQFFFTAYPVLTWVFLFFSSSKIPTSWRPPISVQVLPATETIFFGDNLSNILAASTNSFLDVLAWLPYGMIHFSFPFVLAALVFLFGPPTALRSYAMLFGYMNLIGVIIQNVFPSAPPWYKLIHGLSPADYSMQGSPGGLARIDQLLGFDMYTTTFENSPLVFGAFPSLHSGSATMELLFFSWLFPRASIFLWAYVSWLWWCTMYLTHHYFIDLIAGSCLSVIVFTLVRYTTLPKMDVAKFCRFSYTKLEHLTFADVDNYSYSHIGSYANGNNDDEEYQLATLAPPQQLYLQLHLQQQEGSNSNSNNNNNNVLGSLLQKSADTSIRSRNTSPILNHNTPSTITTEEDNRSSNSSLFEVDINLNSSTTSLSSLAGSNFTTSHSVPTSFKH